MGKSTQVHQSTRQKLFEWEIKNSEFLMILSGGFVPRSPVTGQGSSSRG